MLKVNIFYGMFVGIGREWSNQAVLRLIANCKPWQQKVEGEYNSKFSDTVILVK